MEVNMGIPNYMNYDTNLDQSDFESKTKKMYYLTLVTKLCAKWVITKLYSV